MDQLQVTDGSFGDGFNVKIEFSAQVGRYLVTGKDLEQKETIFEELPLVTGFSGQMDFEPESGAYYCVCTGCFLSLKDVDEDKVFDCPDCGWPFCSETCAVRDVYHKEMECKIFGEKEISQNPETIRSVYFIRSLCLSRRAEDNGRRDGRWSKIRDLTANYMGDAVVNKCSDKDVAMHEFLKEECGIATKPELIATLNGIRNVNAFQINSSDCGDKKYYGMALYHISSIAAHSCHPNVRWRTVMPEEKPGFPMRFQSTIAMSAGASLTIAYRNKCLTIGTLRRREEIQSGHGFLCRCLRCADPTEFETNFSAIRCTKCDLGYLLPKTTEDPGGDWICRTCKGVEVVGYVRDIIDRITGQVNKAKNDEDCKTEEICYKLDTIINKYSGRVLHPNNYLLIWAQFLWLQFMEHDMYVKKSVGLTHQVFVLMQLRAKHCNEIYCKFFSTASKFYGYFEKLRGSTLYIYYLNPEVWEKINDVNRLRVMRKTLEHFQRSLNYDGWERLELEFIDMKIKNVKRIVEEILHGNKSATL